MEHVKNGRYLFEGNGRCLFESDEPRRYLFDTDEPRNSEWTRAFTEPATSPPVINSLPIVNPEIKTRPSEEVDRIHSSRKKTEVHSFGMKKEKESHSGKRINVKEISKNNSIDGTLDIARPTLDIYDIRSEIDLSDLFLIPDTKNRYKEINEENLNEVNLGEGGREFLRAALKITGVSGGSGNFGYKGASNTKLLELSQKAGIWAIVQRCKIERQLMCPSKLHLRFIKYMSDKKHLERIQHLKEDKVKPLRNPDDILQFYTINGTFPKKIVLTDTGRLCLRKTIRAANSRDKSYVHSLCAKQGLKFKELRRWNMSTLLYFIEVLGPSEVTRFCVDWETSLFECEFPIWKVSSKTAISASGWSPITSEESLEL